MSVLTCSTIVGAASGRRRIVTPRKGDYDDLPLPPEGKALADAWDPKKDEAAGEQVSKITSARYDSATQTARVATFFDAWQNGGQVKRTVRDDLICFIGYHELLDLWQRADLSPDTVAGDCEMTPFSAQADRLVLFGTRVED